MIKEGDKVLIGLSGGADSVCLARYLLTVRDSLSVRLHAVHVNHMLRGEESEEDQSFVEAFCRENEIPLTVVKEDVIRYAENHRLSLEEAGREIRYYEFNRIADRMNCDRIAVAHHRGDQAETILFRLIRGTGISGLKGMEPVNGRLIRPLLSVDREEILDILSALSQEYREDSSNASTDYHRNCIRHLILPEMIRMNAGAQEHIAGLSERVMELEEYLVPVIQASYEKYTGKSRKDSCPSGILVREELSKEPAFIRREILREAMGEAAGKKKDIGRIHIDSLEELLFNRAGKQIFLPYHIKALRKPEGLVIYRDTGSRPGETDPGKEALTEGIPLSLRGQLPAVVKTAGLTIRMERIEKKMLPFIKTEEGHCRVLLDYDKINKDLCIRTRRPGDYFIMDSLGHRKLLKQYFIDEKIPQIQRETRLLVASDSHVLWMEDGRVTENAKITGTTRHVLHIDIRKETENERKHQRIDSGGDH